MGRAQGHLTLIQLAGLGGGDGPSEGFRKVKLLTLLHGCLPGQQDSLVHLSPQLLLVKRWLEAGLLPIKRVIFIDIPGGPLCVGQWGAIRGGDPSKV